MHLPEYSPDGSTAAVESSRANHANVSHCISCMKVQWSIKYTPEDSELARGHAAANSLDVRNATYF